MRTHFRHLVSFFIFWLIATGTLPMLQAQGDTVKSLRHMIRQAGGNTVQLQYALAQAYLPFLPDSAVAISQRLLPQVRNTTAGRAEIEVRCLLARASLLSGQLPLAQEQLAQINLLAAQQPDTSLRGYTHLVDAMVLAAQDNPTQASAAFFQALRTLRNSEDRALQAQIHLLLGEGLLARNKGNEAATHSRQALELFRKEQNKQEVSFALIGLGKAYRSIGNADSAQQCFRLALDQYRQQHDTAGMAYAQIQAGTTWRELGDLPQAAAALRQARQLWRGAITQRWQLEGMIEQSTVLLEQNKGALAKPVLDSCMQAARRLQMPAATMACYRLLADAHAQMQDYGAAFRYQRLYTAKKDSLNDIRRVSEAEELEKRYQTARNEEEIKLRGEQIRNQRLQIYSLGAVALSVLILAGFLFFNIQEKRMTNRILEERVANRTERLNRALAQLQTSSQELDTFFYRSSHDLKGPVSTLQGLCNVARMDEDNMPMYLGHIERVVNNMDGLVLAIIAVDAVNRMEMHPIHLPLRPLMEGLRRQWQEHPGFSDRLVVDMALPEQAEVRTDPALLAEALLGVFAHTAEHCAPQGGALVLSYVPETEEFTVVHDAYEVEAENAGKLFNMFFRLSATERGFGLTLYRARVAFQKLGYQVDSRALSSGMMKFTFSPILTESERNEALVNV